MLKSLKEFFSKPAPSPPPERQAEAEEEIAVPEVSAQELLAELAAGASPLLLDVRETYEWNQVHIPDRPDRPVRHIPMNDLPRRLAELPADQPIVVVCAHGNRSYGVTHYLRERAFDVRNLKGGITHWAIRGGEIEQRR